MSRLRHVVAFGAHPDDCEIYAMGALLQFKAAGARITLVVATDGALSLGPPSNSELAAKRKIEAQNAAAMVGAELEMLGFADGYLSLASEAQAAVGAAIERLEPDLIITHHPRDDHRDHRELSRLVTARIGPTQKLLYTEPLLGVVESPNLLIDITRHWPLKESAICAHRTQLAETEILPYIKTWNSFRALQLGGRGVKYAEGYIVPPVQAWNDPMPFLTKVAHVRRL